MKKQNVTKRSWLNLGTLIVFVCLTTAKGQDRNIIFPIEKDNKEKKSISTGEQTFLSMLIPSIDAIPPHQDHLLRNNKTIKTYVDIEQIVKQVDSIKPKLKNMYWSYIIDSDGKYVIGLNLVFGEKSKALIKIDYGDLRYSKELPDTISELVKQLPDLKYLYETSTDYNSSERVIKQDIQKISLKKFNNDTLSYLKRNFIDRDVLYLNKPFVKLFKEMELKTRDYRIFKTSENLVFGLLLKYTNNYYVFMRLKNGIITNNNNLSLKEIKGDIAIMSIVDVREELKRINDELTKPKRFTIMGAKKIDKDENLLKHFYMLN